jgi:hypothetical protein
MVKASDGLTLQSSTALVFLIALATIYAIGLSIIEAHALVPAPGQTQTLWNILFSLILTWWLYADRQVRRFRAPYAKTSRDLAPRPSARSAPFSVALPKIQPKTRFDSPC